MDRPTRRAWTLAERRHHEVSNVPFAIAASADITPRFAAYQVTHLRIYLELQLAAGTYNLRRDGEYICRVVVRTLDSDTRALAEVSAGDVMEGAVLATQLEWPIVTGYVSLDRFVQPGSYEVHMGATDVSPRPWRVIVSDSLFLA